MKVLKNSSQVEKTALKESQTLHNVSRPPEKLTNDKGRISKKAEVLRNQSHASVSKKKIDSSTGPLWSGFNLCIFSDETDDELNDESQSFDETNQSSLMSTNVNEKSIIETCESEGEEVQDLQNHSKDSSDGEGSDHGNDSDYVADTSDDGSENDDSENSLSDAIDSDSKTETPQKNSSNFEQNISNHSGKWESSPIVTQNNLSLNSSGDTSLKELSKKGKRGRLASELTVKSMKKTIKDPKKKTKRVRNKQPCPFCNEQFANLPVHLKRKHSDNEKVQEFLKLPVGSKKRKALIQKLVRKETFKYTFFSDENVDKTLIPIRRPYEHDNQNAKNYSACDYFVTTNHLRHHMKICKRNLGMSDADNNKNVQMIRRKQFLIKSRAITSQYHACANDLVRKKILPVLRNDSVTDAITNDELVMEYANKLSKNYRDPKHYDLIRSTLRMLGRILIEMRGLDDSITDFQSILRSDMYDTCIVAVEKLAELDNGKFKKFSVGLRIGTLLKKITKHYETVLIKKNTDESLALIPGIQRFLKLVTDEYSTDVNKTVLETQSHLQRIKKVELPLEEDVKRLHAFITVNMKQLYDEIKKAFDATKLIRLSKLLLSSLQLFNRRRAGDVQAIRVDEFATHSKLPEKLWHNLNDEEKKIINQYYRFLTRGKLNRTVPILLKEIHVKVIKFIIKHKQSLNVSRSNPFIFGTPNKRTGEYPHLDACECLRTFSVECGAERPELLRGTKLRKHFATACIRLNLSEIELANVADFMGHHKDIHKHIYRQDDGLLQITKLSKILEEAQGSKIDDSDRGDSTDESEDEDKESDDEVNEEYTLDTSLKDIDHSFESDEETSHPVTRKRSPDDDSYQDRTSNLKKKRKLDSHQTKNSTKSLQHKGSPKDKISRQRWTTKQKELLWQKYKDYPTGSFPPLSELSQFIKDHSPIYANKDAAKLKAWLSNQRK